MPSRGRSAGLVGIALALGLTSTSPDAQAQGAQQARDAAMQGRLAVIEAKLVELAAALEVVATRQMTARSPALGDAARMPDRFVLAAMHLQTIVASGRPFVREWNALRGAAPDGAIPGPLADVLTSHAARGLPTAMELRENFTELMPRLLSRIDEDAGFGNWLLRLWRGFLHALSVADAPPQSATRVTLAHVEIQLARGQLAPALGEVESLGPGLQAVLAGWLVKARARVAAEQAVQETILLALSRPN